MKIKKSMMSGVVVLALFCFLALASCEDFNLGNLFAPEEYSDSTAEPGTNDGTPTVTPDPELTVEPSPYSDLTKVIAFDAQSNDNYGTAVAIDGNYMIVGAPDENGGCGAAYIYEREGNTWDSGYKIYPNPRVESEKFGAAVAISDNFVVVGAPGESDSGYTGSGAVYIFRRTRNNAWMDARSFSANDPENARAFGSSVAIDGNYFVVGDPENEYNSQEQLGAVYVFENTSLESSSGWNQVTKLRAHRSVDVDSATGDRFGHSVAISGDSMVVGAPLKDASGEMAASGAAYIFHRSTSGWLNEKVVKVIADIPEASEHFGWSVSIENEWAIIGAPGSTRASMGRGIAYLFQGNGTGAWNPQGLLSATDNEAYKFGYSVGIYKGVAIVGAPNESLDGRLNVGAAYVFQQSGGVDWDRGTRIEALNAHVNDYFAYSVAVNSNNLIIGVPYNEIDNLYDTGAVFTCTIDQDIIITN